MAFSDERMVRQKQYDAIHVAFGSLFDPRTDVSSASKSVNDGARRVEKKLPRERGKISEGGTSSGFRSPKPHARMHADDMPTDTMHSIETFMDWNVDWDVIGREPCNIPFFTIPDDQDVSVSADPTDGFIEERHLQEQCQLLCSGLQGDLHEGKKKRDASVKLEPSKRFSSRSNVHLNRSESRRPLTSRSTSSVGSTVIPRILSTLDREEKSGHMEKDWQAQIDALNSCRRLLVYKKDVVKRHIHRIVVAVVPSIYCLRSNITKQALLLLGDMFVHVPQEIDRELEIITPPLVQKASDTSFLGQAADESIKEMIHNCAKVQVVNSLLKSATHKSAMVRLKVATHIEYYLRKKGIHSLVEHPTTMKALFNAMTVMTGEGNQFTRTMAKRGIWYIHDQLKDTDMWDQLLQSTDSPVQMAEITRFVEAATGPPQVTPLSLSLGKRKSILHTGNKRM